MPSAAKPETGPLTHEIASILRAKMAREKISNTELASAVQISVPQIGRILAGNKQIDLETLDRICWALGLITRDVVKEADEETDGRYYDDDWTVPMLRSGA